MSHHSWGLAGSAHLSLHAVKHMIVGVIIAHVIVKLYIFTVYYCNLPWAIAIKPKS